MKKILFTTLALCFIGNAFACDICGCSVSNYNPFLFPQLSKKGFVGLSYFNRTYQMHSGSAVASKQQFSALALIAQYNVHQKLQVVALLPYSFNHIKTMEANSRAYGVGDATLQANYKAWEKLTKNLRQTFTAGAGIKLQTGKYTKPKVESVEEQNFQLGTGSTDFLVNSSYLLSFRKLVFNAAVSYKYNTQNEAGYRFGDVFTSSVTTVYRKEFSNFSLAPYIQLSGEEQLKDATNHVLIDASGGHVLYSGAGLDLNTSKWAVGVNYQVPISQNLGGGVINVQPRISAHALFNL